MAERSEQDFPQEQDPTGEIRKDLRAVEALQRYFGTSPGRPAANARVVQAGEERAEIPEENSLYNPTDFLGLNAEMENFAPEGDPREIAPQAAVAQGSPGAQPNSWLLEHDEATQGSSATQDLPRATALDASFVEPEGRTERTRRMFLPILGAAAVVAAAVTAWRLTVVDVPTQTRLAGSSAPTRTWRDQPPEPVQSERWSMQTDGSIEPAPVGDAIVQPTAVEEPGELLTESGAHEEAPITARPGEQASNAPKSTQEQGAAEAEAVLAALEELTLAEQENFQALDELPLDEAPADLPSYSVALGESTLPFPWPSTLVSKLQESAGVGPRWRVTFYWETAAEACEDFSDAALVAAADPLSGSEPTSPTTTTLATLGRSRSLSGDELARWMLFGPEVRSWPAVEQTTQIDQAQIALAQPDPSRQSTSEDQGAEALALESLTGTTSAPNETLDPIEEKAKSYSILRRAKGTTEHHWWGEEVPNHLIDAPHDTLTPEVGRVRLTTAEGDVFVGRLASVGRRMLSLESERGSLSLPARGVRSLERLGIDTRPKTLSTAGDTDGLKTVRVVVPGGRIVGRLVERHGDEVTLITESGGRVTLLALEVEEVNGERPLALIRGRAGK